MKTWCDACGFEVSDKLSSLEVANGCVKCRCVRYTHVRPCVIPTVHLNGTNKGDLVHQYRQMADSLREAVQMLRRHYPHERDYYVQPALAHHRAGQDQDSRIERVRGVLDEIEHIMEKIDEQE